VNVLHAGGKKPILIRQGFAWSLPAWFVLLVGFVGPLFIVLFFSFLPPGTFGYEGDLTLANYVDILRQGYVRTYVLSFLLAIITVVITLVLAYPVAYALIRIFSPRWALVIIALLTLPLFVSENIRLFGWSLILGKSGYLGGTIQMIFGIEVPGLLYNVPAIVLGLVYIYFPFMLFPLVLGLSMVPKDLVDASRDLGASRVRAFWEVEVPLARPGILIGVMLTFVLSLGAIAESVILGGKSIVMIATDIERAFSYQQNWPLGSALSVVLIVFAGVFVWLTLRHLDMNLFISRRNR
jgi:spermidine/putrescine transport system permease protein